MCVFVLLGHWLGVELDGMLHEVIKIDILLLFEKEQFTPNPVVDKVHRSSTWVKVQIRIIKYYSSKSKSTAFSILLEWKYKSTQFFDVLK